MTNPKALHCVESEDATTIKRAALYARFSSDLQKDRSIDDQLAICEAVAKRENLRVVARFTDRAKSGASLFDRDGLVELMRAAKNRQFDVVIVEALDRLSRDQEDLAGLNKKLDFWSIGILTVNEGLATPIHIGIRSIVNSVFLKDLGNKVRRGHMGRVAEGKFPGAVTYGYRRILGKPGEREIDHEQASVVRRIFHMYADGVSPRYIALKLTQEKIPTPKGAKAWNHQTFISGGVRGIIGNRLYIGELVWNRRKTVVNPETGKRTKRPGDESNLRIVSVPALRIIEQNVWDAAEAMRRARAVAKFGHGGKVQRRPIIPRNSHWLAGLLRCGACGGHMRIAQQSRDGNPRVACAAAHQHGTCGHRKSYDLGGLQTTILDGMQQHLTDPEAVARLVKGYRDEMVEQEKRDRTIRSEVTDIRRQIANIDVKIDRLIAAIRDSDSPHLVKALDPLEAERVALEERLRLAEARSNIVTLHPSAAKTFCLNVQKLHEALLNNPNDPAGRAAFRNVMDSIIVHPTAKRMPYEVSPVGRVDALLGISLFPTARTSGQILAEQGVACSDNGNPGKSVLPVSQQPKVIALGRWRSNKAA